ncbi:hypothetical protein MMAS_47230 [Mycobacteroides abscessus subsp. massiliense CCUG 48898 = JCM 15300]|nr:hypothetical protein MMAS_47230 [Mycobacteroides abscessus subsp. massiliense CCUG 48898 = JCM 15300]
MPVVLVLQFGIPHRDHILDIARQQIWRVRPRLGPGPYQPQRLRNDPCNAWVAVNSPKQVMFKAGF